MANLSKSARQIYFEYIKKMPNIMARIYLRRLKFFLFRNEKKVKK